MDTEEKKDRIKFFVVLWFRSESRWNPSLGSGGWGSGGTDNYVKLAYVNLLRYFLYWNILQNCVDLCSVYFFSVHS